MTVPEQTEHHEPRFQMGVEVETHLSWLQSRMSTERTLMSLVRASTSMIAVGFAVVELAAQANLTNSVVSVVRPEAPRNLGLALIAAGTLLVVAGLWHYRVLLTFLWSADYRSLAGTGHPARGSGTVGIAVLLVLIGVFTFGASLLRVH